MGDFIEENIHPCNGCLDFNPPDSNQPCKSNGGCGRDNLYYNDLVEKLRDIAAFAYLGEGEDAKRIQRLISNAADAIEELMQIAGHYKQESKDWFAEACAYKAKINDTCDGDSCPIHFPDEPKYDPDEFFSAERSGK